MRPYIYACAILAVISGCSLQQDEPSLTLIANDYCGINAPIGPEEYEKKAPLQPWGWAFDQATGKIPEKIAMQIISEDNKIGITTAMTRTSRPDVAKAFGRAELEMAGYGGKIDVSSLLPGVYTVSIIQSDGTRTSICTSPSKIVLK